MINDTWKDWVSPRGDGQTDTNELRLMALINGAKPLNAEEVAIKREIDKMIADGIIIDIPTSL